MSRITSLRTQKNPINPKDVAYPFAYINDEFMISDIQVPVLNEHPLFSAGDFPENIKKYYWIQKGEDGIKDWHALVYLTNRHYALFGASCPTTGFQTGKMSLVVSPYYDLLVRHAMSDKVYNTYIENTELSHSQV
jgi:hypothetical protein